MAVVVRPVRMVLMTMRRRMVTMMVLLVAHLLRVIRRPYRARRFSQRAVFQS